MVSAESDVHTRQRVEALARANQVRQARAELKRRIAVGHVSAAEVVVVPRWEIEGMRVADVLMSQRQWGRVRCRKLLVAIGLDGRKPIGAMTERQRGVLAEAIAAETRASASGCRTPANADRVPSSDVQYAAAAREGA
jgi:hypothetical protein